MSAAQTILTGSAILVIGSVAAALSARHRRTVGPIAFLFVLAAGVLVFSAALRVLISDQAVETATLLNLPVIGATLAFRVDQLSALFLLVIAVISTLATLYSVSYMQRYRDEHLVRYYPLLLLFFAGVIGVVCVADWLFFLVFWEFMTICSYFLIIFEKENRASVRAGFKYMVMTHAATALMLIAIIVVWQASESRSFSFAAAGDAIANLAVAKPVLLHVLLALWFIGFGTKAGVLPFGDWLPDAYPAAPSGASAAFAGTMTNLGLYGLLRVFLQMLAGPDPAAVGEFCAVWGILIALFGAVSIFVGTITALSQDDSKRLLAFQMIGQMGYVLVAVGAGLYLLPSHPTVGMLAVMAAVFHVVNGACYKPLLFFNAGSILLRSGQRNLNRMSGLAMVMPLTAFGALIASMSIAGMPPFNGFASKWMIYHVTILGVPQMPLFLLLGIVALFVSLVTLAAFLKFLGGAFMGASALSEEEAKAGDVPFGMQLPQVVLACLCIGFGLVPVLPLTAIYRAVGSLGALSAPPALATLVGDSWVGLELSLFGAGTTGVWLPVVILAALVLASLAAHWVSRLGASEKREVSVWHCGALISGPRARYVVVEPKSEPSTAALEARYQAHGLYGAFKAAFRSIYPSVPLPRVPYPRRLMSIFDADTWLYQPLVRAGDWLTERFSRTHSGVPQQYLIWQLLGFVVVIIVLALWAR
jgi:hydrogenase-4 component B